MSELELQEAVHITGDSSVSMGLPVVSGQTSELCPGDPRAHSSLQESAWLPGNQVFKERGQYLDAKYGLTLFKTQQKY